jgi:hypothetical protein
MISHPQVSASDLYDGGNEHTTSLRIGVVTYGTSVPSWVNYILSHVTQLDALEIVTWIILKPRNAEAPSPLVKLYGWVDRLAHPQRLGHEVVNEALDLGATTPAVVYEADNNAYKTIADLGLDIVLCLGPADEDPSRGSWARLGAWYLEFGDETTSTSWPGRMIIDRDPKTVVSLKSIAADDGRISTLFRAVGSTHGNLWCSENLHWSYLKAAGIVSRCLRQAARCGASPNAANESVKASKQGPPDTITMASFLTDALGRSQRYRKLARRFNEQWVLGIRPHHGASAIPCMNGFRLIEPPDTGFYADPFLMRAYGRSWVFFEELPFDSGKGHISYMLLDDAGVPERVGPALELDYHLSYPFVFEWQGQHYMIPESAAANAVELFRAERFPDKWVRVATLLQGYPMVDATLHREGKQWYMFVNVSETGGRLDDELFLFVADHPFGPWKPHPRNPIKSDASCARSAGPIFRVGEKLMRPSQDSIGGYGQAIVFSEITRISPTDYQDRWIARAEPEWAPNLNGCHHFASDGQFDIIDGRRFHPKSRAGAGEGAIRRET